jgi:hypothetical protein
MQLSENGLKHSVVFAVNISVMWWHIWYYKRLGVQKLTFYYWHKKIMNRQQPVWFTFCSICLIYVCIIILLSAQTYYLYTSALFFRKLIWPLCSVLWLMLCAVLFPCLATHLSPVRRNYRHLSLTICHDLYMTLYIHKHTSKKMTMLLYTK